MIPAFNMEKISVELENCYGIRKLKYQFDFSKRHAYAIYAPNGSMKTSFAATFKDISKGESPKDRIFPERQTVCRVSDEKGNGLPKEMVLVLPPYDAVFGPGEKTCTLLVNNALRREFEKLHEAINASKTIFLAAMKDQSKSRKRLDREIALAFTNSETEEDFYIALARVKDELADQKDAPFADVSYDSIFDETIEGALETKECKTAIEAYIKRYNQLIDASTYFKKGIFEYFNAEKVAKALADHGFFKASHTVTLNAAEKKKFELKKNLPKSFRRSSTVSPTILLLSLYSRPSASYWTKMRSCGLFRHIYAATNPFCQNFRTYFALNSASGNHISKSMRDYITSCF
jgi:hypothetical protein